MPNFECVCVGGSSKNAGLLECELKITIYIFTYRVILLYLNLMVTTNQKPVIYTEKKTRKESKPNTKIVKLQRATKESNKQHAKESP